MATENSAAVTALQGWHHANERAARFNRNLMQFAGGLAALLGISGGSAAVAATGISVERLGDGAARWVVFGFATAIAIVIALTALTLVYQMLRAYRLRLQAEVSAGRFLDSLIRQDPERFWPDAPAAVEYPLE